MFTLHSLECLLNLTRLLTVEGSLNFLQTTLLLKKGFTPKFIFIM